jgi:hypothetical protein
MSLQRMQVQALASTISELNETAVEFGRYSFWRGATWYFLQLYCQATQHRQQRTFALHVGELCNVNLSFRSEECKGDVGTSLNRGATILEWDFSGAPISGRR